MTAHIITNIASSNARRNVNASQSPLTTFLKRLSADMRINSAKDDDASITKLAWANSLPQGVPAPQRG